MDDDGISKLMLAYVLFAVGFLICLVSLFVSVHSAIVDTSALHRYQQDCASEVSVRHTSDTAGGCYTGIATIQIARQENVIVKSHRYLRMFEPSYTYQANLSLPDNTQAQANLTQTFGTNHLSYSGDGKVQVWNNNVTWIEIAGDTDQTNYSPPFNRRHDLINIGLSILGMVVFGGLIWFFNRRDSALRYS